MRRCAGIHMDIESHSALHFTWVTSVGGAPSRNLRYLFEVRAGTCRGIAPQSVTCFAVFFGHAAAADVVLHLFASSPPASSDVH
jgi:hypothetical protein